MDYIRSIYRHREIVWALVWRDFSTRYKQAVLGVGWAVLYPIVMTLILWAFVVLHPSQDPGAMPPLLRFYSGLHPYNLFTSGVIYGTISVVANAGLVTKVRVPSDVFPLSAVLSALFDFAFGSIAFLALLLFYRVAPTWNVLWVVPILLVEIVFTLAVVQVMAAACVIARDLRYGAPILCQIGLFLVPVIYPVPDVPEVPQWLHWCYMANPMAVFVDAFRRATVEGLGPRGPSFLLACGATLVAFWMSCLLFRNARAKFADLV